MTKALIKPIDEEEWYQQLLEECQAIFTETIFASKMVLIQGYHMLGTRLLEEHANFERKEIYGQEITTRVARSLGKSQRTIQRAVQFARQYPTWESVKELPEGKNISWARICNKYLVKKKDKEQCPHPNQNRHYFYQCGVCDKWVKLDKSQIKK